MEVDVGPAVEHIYEVIDVSCACSVGLSRLVWKADIIVKKKKKEEEDRGGKPDHTVGFAPVQIHGFVD